MRPHLIAVQPEVYGGTWVDLDHVLTVSSVFLAPWDKQVMFSIQMAFRSDDMQFGAIDEPADVARLVNAHKQLMEAWTCKPFEVVYESV